MSTTDDLYRAWVLLRESAKTFREYEKLHYAKGTPEGNVKASRNGALAADIEEFLYYSGGC